MADEINASKVLSAVDISAFTVLARQGGTNGVELSRRGGGTPQNHTPPVLYPSEVWVVFVNNSIDVICGLF